MRLRYVLRHERSKVPPFALNGKLAHQGLIYIEDNDVYLAKNCQVGTILGYLAPAGLLATCIGRVPASILNDVIIFETPITKETIYVRFRATTPHFSLFMQFTNNINEANVQLHTDSSIVTIEEISPVTSQTSPADCKAVRLVCYWNGWSVVSANQIRHAPSRLLSIDWERGSITSLAECIEESKDDPIATLQHAIDLLDRAEAETTSQEEAQRLLAVSKDLIVDAFDDSAMDVSVELQAEFDAYLK